tara:strand:+ start:4357 stop:4842 length:486 start_codon:yes stop_codon:yes gene_type:complete
MVNILKSYINWKSIDKVCDIIVNQIKESKLQPDNIIGLSRGGLIPATIIANKLQVRKVYVHGYHSYDDTTNLRADHGEMYQDVLKATKTMSLGNILIVDDLCDEGITMSGLVNRLVKSLDSEQYKISSAAMYCKQHSKFQPNYIGEKVDNDWLVFPWELIN